MKNNQYKDYKLRKNISSLELDQIFFKSLLLNENISKEYKFKIMLKLQMVYKNLFKNRIINRCFRIGKNRSILRDFNLSKQELKKDFSSANICGFKKSS